MHHLINSRVRIMSEKWHECLIVSAICKQNSEYLISSVIRPRFFFFQNKHKDLDPSYKMDLDLWDCLGRVKLVL